MKIGSALKKERLRMGLTQDEMIQGIIKKVIIQKKGLDYVIGQDGDKLSGGQKQRIEIARAVYFDRSIIIADEATSSLDNKLSQEIHNALISVKDKTIIEVAHKISDNDKNQFDKVVELDKLN